MAPTKQGTALIAVPVRPHKYPVIDHITSLTEAAYSVALRDLDLDLRSILKNARGVTEKSLVVYLRSDGRPVRGEILMKGEKGKKIDHHKAYDRHLKTGKVVRVPQKGVAPPEEEKEPRRKGKQEDKKKEAPGWYRDEHGNLQFLDRGTFRYNKKMSDEEVSSMHQRVYALLTNEGEGGAVQDALIDANTGLDEQDIDNLLAVGLHLSRYGGTPEDVFSEMVVGKDCSAAEAAEVWGETNQRVEAALALPEVQKVLKQADKDAADTSSLVKEVADDLAPLDGHAQSWLHGDPERGTLKIIATAIEVGALSIVEKRSDVAVDDRSNWQKLRGKFAVQFDVLDLLANNTSRLNSETCLALAFAAQLSGNASLSEDLIPTFDKAARTGLHQGRSDEEKTDLDGKISARLNDAKKLLEAWNGDTGGKSLDKLVAAKKEGKLLAFVTAEEGDAADAAVEELKQADQDYEKLILDCKEAQTNEATPVGGYSKDLKIDLLPHQKKFVNWGLTVKRGINAADMGLGKALRFDMPVLTTRGWVQISELAVGDAAYGTDGKPHAVLGVYPQGVRPMYTVEFTDGSTVVCDEEHLWTVSTKLRRSRGLPWRTLSLRQIMDEGVSNGSQQGYRHFIPVASAVQYATADLPVDPYTLGALLGDGSMGSGSIRLTTDDEDMLKHLVLPDPVLWRRKMEGEYALTVERGSGANPLMEALRTLGVYGHTAGTKFIPDTYKVASVEQRFALLQGLLDTDGYAGESVQFYTSSPQLRDDVVGLVQSLGGVCRTRSREAPAYPYKGEVRYGMTAYRLTVSLPSGLGCPFRVNRKREMWHAPVWEPRRAIKSITSEAPADAVCIKVAAEDMLFLTQGFVVTHNTPMTIATVDHLINTGKAERGILVMPPGLLAQWPEEIEKFRPGSSVHVIDDSYSAEDRLLLLQDINSGKTKADFVLMSSGMARQYDKSKIKIEGVEFDDETGELVGGKEVETEEEIAGQKVKTKARKLTKEQLDELRSAIREDPWLKALKTMKGATFYDEAHAPSQGLKNPDNVSNIACSYVNEGREYSQFLTGTPIPNTPIDLFHLMNTVHPGSAGPSASKFISRIAHWETRFNQETQKEESVLVGYENLAELRAAIGPFCFIKSRDDADVAKHMKLPGITEKKHLLKLYPEQQTIYDRSMKEWFNAPADHVPGDTGDKRFNELVKINQMRQAAIHPKLLDPDYKGRGVKIDQTVKLIQDKFSDPKNADRPVVVFCSYSSAFDILEDELVAKGIDRSQIGRIASGVSAKKRGVSQDAANAGKKRVLLVGVQAGGAGLNLQGTDIPGPDGKMKHVGPDSMIYIDKPWAPGTLDQSKGRVYRLGQKNPVTAHHIRVAGSYDDKLLEKLQQKVQVVAGMRTADKNQDMVEIAMKGDVARLLAEVVRDPSKASTLLGDDEESGAQVREAMSGLLGVDPKGTGDEILARSLGMDSLTSPAAQKRLAELRTKKLPDFMKEVFNESDFVEQRELRSYYQMGKQRLINKRTIADIKLRKKMIGKREHEALMKQIDRGIKTWEKAKPVWDEAQAKGKKITKKEIDTALEAKAEAEPKAPDTGTAAPSRKLKVDKAKIQRAKVKTGKKQKSGKAAKMEKPAKGGKTKFLKKKAAYKGEMGLYVDLGLFDDTDGSKEGIAKWLKKELGEGPKLAAKLHAKLLKDGVVG